MAELRATEIYVRTLADQLTLRAHTARGESVSAELWSVHEACCAAQAAIKPVLAQLDPVLAGNAELAADIERQRAELITA